MYVQDLSALRFHSTYTTRCILAKFALDPVAQRFGNSGEDFIHEDGFYMIPVPEEVVIYQLTRQSPLKVFMYQWRELQVRERQIPRFASFA